jgi:hypothetical protein
MVLTLHLYVLYGSQNKKATLTYTTLNDWLFINEVNSQKNKEPTRFFVFLYIRDAR